jgi:hypothetical protein
MSIKNISEVSIEFLVKTLNEETKAKNTVEVKGSKRRAIALQVALAYPITAQDWAKIVSNYDSGDDKLRATARDAVIATFGGADLDGPQKTNHIKRALDTITFVCDILKLGMQDDVIFNDRGGATVAGSSPLAAAIWRSYKWAGLKTMEERSVSEAIKVVPKQSDKKHGEVSWPMIENVIRELAGRKSSGQNAKAGGKSLTPDKPIEMLKALGSMSADVDPVHFSNGAACVAAINTAEDVMALALEKPELKAMAKDFEKLFQQAREALGMERDMSKAA